MKRKVIVLPVVLLICASLLIWAGCEGDQAYEGTWIGDVDGMTITLVLTKSSFTVYMAMEYYGGGAGMVPLDAPVEGDFVLGMKGSMDVTEDTMLMTVTNLGWWLYQDSYFGDDGWLSEDDYYWYVLYNYYFYWLYYYGGGLTPEASYRLEGDTLYLTMEGQDEIAFTKQ